MKTYLCHYVVVHSEFIEITADSIEEARLESRVQIEARLEKNHIEWGCDGNIKLKSCTES